MASEQQDDIFFFKHISPESMKHCPRAGMQLYVHRGKIDIFHERIHGLACTLGMKYLFRNLSISPAAQFRTFSHVLRPSVSQRYKEYNFRVKAIINCARGTECSSSRRCTEDRRYKFSNIENRRG
jgi:hypothetical protein